MKSINNESINITNRVYIEGKSNRPFVRKVAKFLTCFLLAAFIFKILMDGFSFEIIKENLITILLLVYLFISTKKIGYYRDIPAKILFKDNSFSVVYENIDREDKMGLRKEETEIYYDEVQTIDYSNELGCFKITSKPILKVNYFKGNKEYIRDYRKKKKTIDTFIYASDISKKQLELYLKRYTGKFINELN